MYQIFFYAALFIGIIPICILLLQKKAFSTNDGIIPFVWLTGIATVYELIGTVIFKINTNYWFQLYPLLEFLAVFYFFSNLFKEKYKIIFRVFLALFIISYFLSFIFWSSSQKFLPLAINTIPLTVFVLFCSYAWFKRMFETTSIENPWQNSSFYFVSGFLVYHSSTFLLFILGNYLFNSNKYIYDYWLVNILATFVLRTFLIIGVCKMKQD